MVDGGRGVVQGSEEVLTYVRTAFSRSLSSSRRVTHEDGQADGSAFDYDLFVIGGGSGGIACAKEAARLGARVALADFVKPSWQNTRWGLGGTCVNVGCIPKKLMHTAAIMGEARHEAKHFGWDPVPAAHGPGAEGQAPMSFGTAATHDAKSVRGQHSWEKLVEAVQNHIASLNFGYKNELRSKGVAYKNALATFQDAHTVELVNKQRKRSTATSARFVVAVGGRPRPLTCPGHELTISSDDLFSLDEAPGRTCVVGAGYVALESAGLLAGLGYDVVVLVRSILLRGFDREAADAIRADLETRGVRFIVGTTPLKVEEAKEEEGEKGAASSASSGAGGSPGEGEGRLQVTWKDPASGEEVTERFGTVLAAAGRIADTRSLGLDKVGIVPAKNGKLDCEDEQTSAPNIYAVGDVVNGKPELTPVAIMAGKLLSRRLFGEGPGRAMDYELVPTTVFTPLEYGTIGLSEEDAIERHGEDAVEVYHSKYHPLEWTVVEERESSLAQAKLIVLKKEAERVIGFHYLGPHAGEVTQGFATAMRLGCTRQDLLETVGIHPTSAEEFTILGVSKSSGEDAQKSGC